MNRYNHAIQEIILNRHVLRTPQLFSSTNSFLWFQNKGMGKVLVRDMVNPSTQYKEEQIFVYCVQSAVQSANEKLFMEYISIRALIDTQANQWFVHNLCVEDFSFLPDATPTTIEHLREMLEQGGYLAHALNKLNGE